MINLDEKAIIGTEDKYTMTEETDFLESYFRSGLENASELSDAYTEASSDLYTALKEGVMNSISAFTSFYGACKNIFTSYMVRLNNNMYNQYSSAFKARIREDKKIIDKYKSKLNSYSGKPIELPVTRYEYSNIFDDSIPSLKIFESFKNDRDQTNMILRNAGDETRKQVIKKEFEEVKTYITSGDCYNNARATILKKDDPIEACDYAKVIFDVFRSGGDQVVDYAVTPKQIQEIVKRFYSYEKYVDSIDGMKRKVFSQYNRILENLQKYDMYQLKGIEYDEETLRDYCMYTKLKADQLKHYCSLYLTAFDGKLDAMANSYMQDRDTLFRICGYITSDVVEGKEEDL